LTGPNNSGTALHRHLAYPMKCGVTGTPYTVSYYTGKQVRDNIDSTDLVPGYTGFAAPCVRAGSTTAASSAFLPARRSVNHRKCHDW
jgi:hypothetical protein